MSLDLREWLDAYLAASDQEDLQYSSDLIQQLESDILDEEYINCEVRRLRSTADVRDGFCFKCRHLFDNWPDPVDGASEMGRLLHTNEIEAAAEVGCKFCAFLLTRLKDENQLKTFRQIEARFRSLDHQGMASLGIETRDPQSQKLRISFPDRHASFFHSPVVIGSRIAPSSAEKWTKLATGLHNMEKEWLDECDSSHTGCRSAFQHELPTRLVSIANSSIKLVLTANLSPAETPLKYATFSYCWGDGQFIKTTPDSYPSFLEDIPIEEMPKTLSDAIQIARHLGISYIWIDALCIIQDEEDHADWKRESARMQSVYGGSYVNIAASSAKDVHQGCFLRPDGYSSGAVARVKVVGNDEHRWQNFYDPAVYVKSTIRTHLATRAWAYQERLLAPRTIHYGATGVFWECRTTVRSEFMSDDFFTESLTLTLRPEAEALYWPFIVWQYSSTQLTYNSDYLPALSGIAKRQQQVKGGGQYLAGMWKDDLLEHLLWRRVGMSRKRPPWRAPTWSWMSVDGENILCLSSGPRSKYLHGKYYIDILQAETVPSGEDPFGAICEGKLVIAYSKLLRAKSSPDLVERGVPGQNLVFLLENGRIPFTISTDCLEEETKETVYLLPVCRDEDVKKNDTMPSNTSKDSIDETEPDENRDLSAQNIKTQGGGEGKHNRGQDGNDTVTGVHDEAVEDDKQEYRKGPDDEEENYEKQDNDNKSDGRMEDTLRPTKVSGIALDRCGESEGHFRRIGWFRVFKRPSLGVDDPLEEFLKIMGTIGTSTAREMCASRVSKEDSTRTRHRYTMTIV